MKQVILHIGMHKTGTTSIQNSLHGLETDGIRYARFPDMNHSKAMYTIFSGSRYKHHSWQSIGFTENQIDKEKDYFFKILEEELSDNSITKLVISGEDISAMSPAEQKILCSYFQSKNIILKVVYIVRDPHNWSVSSIQQQVKGGAKELLAANPFYRRRIAGFIKGCGIENISIYKYEDLVKHGLIKSFSEIIGTKLKEKKRMNESMTLEAFSLILILNNLELVTTRSLKQFKKKQQFIQSVINFFSIKNGYTKINMECFDIVHKDVKEDLIWMKEQFGISYALKNHDAKNKLSSEFNYSLSSKDLNAFFKFMKLAYDNNLSVKENLKVTYLKYKTNTATSIWKRLFRSYKV